MRKLYALVSNRDRGYGYGPIVVQVSFNKEELEEMAEYLNSFTYFPANAEVKEVTEHVVEWYWPRSDRQI